MFREATIWLRGKPLASKILESIKLEYEGYKLKEYDIENIIPRLDIILANDRSDSKIYIKKKMQAMSQMGFSCHLHQVSRMDKLKGLILDLNNDKRVHGIIVQSPIEASSSPLSSLNGIGNQNDNDNDRNYQSSVYELISPEKDIDGLHPINQGKLFNVSSPLPLLIPCTAKGIMKLLEYYNIAINGKVAVIIGRSQIVGLPISHLLNRANATIIQCHSHTKNISDYVRMADILICAIGKPNYIKSEWLSFKTAVIDVGINYVNGKIVGDVEEEQKESKELKENENFNSHYIHYNEKINIHKNVYNRVWAKSPVPGGVGPMTVAMLIDNLWLAFKNQFLNNLPFDHPIRLNLTSKNSNNK